MKLPLILTFLLMASPVWAGDDYSDKRLTLFLEDKKDIKELLILVKNIEWQLDEISKKMDKTDAPKCAPQD